MKKKGFTLVELLAVIVIISIIAIITIPIVLNNVTSAEKKSFKVSVNEVKRNVDRYLVKNDLKKLPTCGDNNVVLKNIDFLKNRNVFTDDSYMCYDDENACDYIYAKSNLKKSGKVILAYGCFDDIKYEEGQKENDDNLKKPEIANLSFVNTSSSISVNVDWKDEIDPDSIRFAIRKVDGGKLSKWQKSSEFKNLKNDTEYKIIVKAKNKRGIVGDAQDTTKTFDIDVPTYSKDVDTTYSDKDINVTIKYPAPRNGESYTYFYTLDSGATWVETKDKTATIRFTENGNVSARVFDGTNYKDASEYIVNGIDKTTPSCSVKVASGSKGNNGWYTSNTTIKLTTSKAGASGIEYSTPTLSSEEYKFKVSNGKIGESSSSFTADGNFEVYGYVKNGVGKTAKCTLDYKKDSNPTSVDVTLKTKSGSTYTQGKYSNEDIVLTAVPKNSTSPSGYSYSWYKVGSENSIGSSKSYTATESGLYYVTVTSGSGVSKTTGKFIINVDKCIISEVGISGKKATAGTSISSGTWSNQNIVLTAKPKCTTGGNSGYSYEWYYNGVSTNVKTKTYTATTSGSYTVKVTLGNGQEASSSTYAAKIDKTAPTCNITVASGTLGANDWYTNNVTLKMTASTGGSGIDKYTAFSTSSSATYGKSGGGQKKLEISRTISSDGTYTYYGYVKNKAGVTGKCSKSIKIDKTPPASGFASKDYCLKSNIAYVLTEDGSGISNSYCELFNSKTNIHLRSFVFSNTNKEINLNPKSYGEYKISCHIGDNAGNQYNNKDLKFNVKPCSGDSITFIPDISGKQSSNNCGKGNCIEECNGRLCYAYGPTLISTTAYGTTTNKLYLHKDSSQPFGYQYGPYMRFEPGCYTVKYIGYNLNASGLDYKSYVVGSNGNMVTDYTTAINQNIVKTKSTATYKIDYKGTSDNNGLEFAIWVRNGSISPTPYMTSITVKYEGTSCQ